MRIAILVHDITSFGGVEHVSILLAKKISAECNSVDIISLRNRGKVFFDIENLNLLNVDIKSRCGKFKKNDYKLIADFFLQHQYDKIIIQLSTAFRNLCPLADARLLKILYTHSKLELVFHESPKYFITRYNVYYEKGLVLFLRYLLTYFYYNPNIYYFMNNSRKYVSQFVTLSKGCQQELLKCFGINSVVRYNPYDFVQSCIPLRSKKNKIIWAGRLSAEKNLILLIRAWNGVIDKKNWVLEIVGDGNEKKNIMGIIEHAHVENIVLTDAISHDVLMKKFEESKILILPSFFEAFPTVIPEAMNRKNAVICTRYDGFSDELVKDGSTGFVVNFNESELAERISNLIYDEETLLRMQKNAYEVCKKMYSI